VITLGSDRKQEYELVIFKLENLLLGQADVQKMKTVLAIILVRL
jgi:hypothetical protein